MKLTLLNLTLLLTSTYGYVTNNVKFTETTTKLPDDNISEESANKKTSVNVNESSKSRSNYIYLEDVLVGLKLQNWTEEEMPCLNQTLVLIRSLQNFTLWAVWEWDSVSSQPLGILSGNRYQLGNFDQCMNPPWLKTHPEVQSQYCLAEVSLERTDNAKKRRLDDIKPYENALDFIQHHTPNYRPLSYLTWGACVPAVCQPRSVERLVSAVLARSHLGAAGLRPRIAVSEPCQQRNSPREFDGVFYAFIAVMVVLAIVCLICTIITARKRENDNSLSLDICKAFCLKENSKDLLRMQKEGIEVIYGIRYLTICFIVMCHQAGMLNSGPISNGIGVDKELALSPFAVFLLHDDVFVDTFFVISGFLMAKTITSYKRLPNIFVLALKRYIRLVVALAVVIFYVCAIFPYTGSGPLWERFKTGETGACRANWWVNLLMLSNYVNTDNVCIVVSWYIPCDFHLFVLSCITYALYKRWRYLGLAIASVLSIASIIAPGVVNYVNNLSAVQLFTFDFVADPRANEQFQLAYIKTHTRAAAYIIGFFAGSYFNTHKSEKDLMLSKKRSLVGACAAVVIMLLVMVSGTSYLWRNYSPTEGALYAALNRPVWAVGLVMLILCCSFGKVPLLKSFLSWYPWVPLSRLAYGLYLVHTVLIIRNVGIARNPVYYDNLSVFMSSLSVIALGTFYAYIIWLLAEAPINNLFMLLVKRRKVPLKPSAPDNFVESQPGTSCAKTGNTNTGYLHDNIKENLNISSKM
ncbi:hypothetical protein ABMA28_007773 [Loxostege sticticalis]|uniref:Nose resistant to fluoxetine protein 6 n=1 Tax=Loxostege sticticalis TaxID=481309 RepID=A0ABD0SIQ1_LOXSC